MSALIIEVHPSSTFAKKENRRRFVKYVAAILSAGDDRPFEAHQINASSAENEWAVDSGNDWWVFFDQDNPLRVHIKQRNDVMECLVPLGQLVAYRWRAKVIAPEAVAA